MNEEKTEKISLLMVFAFSLLMITFIFVQVAVFELFETPVTSFQQRHDDDPTVLKEITEASRPYTVLKGNARVVNFIDPSVSPRTLEYFYALRAYDGPPPVIPHPISEEASLTGDTCLGCHRYGGFTPEFQAYAPVSPHPEMLNCRQCHNPQEVSSLFKETAWTKGLPRRGRAHLPGGPLVIPHSIQMRENCLSCHAGPGAVSEIRTTHPERIDCMQCHVERQTEEIWVRR